MFARLVKDQARVFKALLLFIKERNLPETTNATLFTDKRNPIIQGWEESK
jgi:hypothetical protein